MKNQLCRIAGAAEEAFFEDCDSEKTRFAALGLVLLIPAFLGFFAGTNVVFEHSESLSISLFAGVVWSTVVFLIDRALVVSYQATLPPLRESYTSAQAFFWGRCGRWFRVLSTLGGRLALGVLLGLVISHSLVNLLFRSEIREQLHAEAEATIANRTEHIETRLTDLRQEQVALQRRVRDARVALSEAMRNRQKEVAGVRGPGFSGKFGDDGPVTHQWNLIVAQAKLDVQVAETESREQAPRLQGETEAFLQELSRLEQRIQERQAWGYMARARALSRLAAESPELRRNRTVFLLLFLFFEILPIGLKAAIAGGPYGMRLALHEWKVQEHVLVEYEAYAGCHESRTQARRVEIMTEEFSPA